ncbi:MAG TPA: ABC transporter permease subunit [Clostridia bacterium]|nr:ABC transporter permease subunit [Clostridia bacterium]
MKQIFYRITAAFLGLLCLVGLLGSCGAKLKSPITSVAQANDAIYTIGVPSGATAVYAVESALPKAKMQYYNSLSDAYLAVQQGKIDAFAFDRSLLQFAIGNGLTGVKVLDGTIGNSDNVAIGISRKSKIDDLQAKINALLAELRADGTLDDMFRRWVIDADDTMPDIEKPQNPTMTLKVATSGTVQPFSYYKGSALTGYDMELAQRLALYLNAEIDMRVYDYDGFPSAAEAGTIDCILANLNATEERGKTMDFSDALFKTETGLLVQDTKTPQNNMASPETATYGITSVVAQDHLSKQYPKAKLTMYPSATDAMLALQNGKVDYVMTSRSTALYMIKQDNFLDIHQDNVVNEACYIAIAQGRAGLKNQINAVLSRFKSDGVLSELNTRWTNDGPDYYRTMDVPKAEGKNGVLKVALSPDVPPICFIQDGHQVGINVELVERIAYELDMTVEFSAMDFSALLPALQAGKADLALSDINATDERKKLVDFTEPYFDNPQVLVARKTPNGADGAPEYTALSQLSGKVISSQTGSVADLLVNSVVANVTYSYFNTRSDLLEALKNGKVEAVPLDEPMAELAVAQNPSLTILRERVVEDHYGVALQKNSPMTADVNAAIAKLRGDGTLAQMKEKWTGPDESAKVLPELDYPGANGVLRVAHDTSGNPMCYVGADGKALGYDLELMLRIGEILDRKVVLTSVDFSGLIPMLQSGKADAAVGCMSITDERRQAVDMSDSYYDGGLYLVVRKSAGTTEKIQNEHLFDGLKHSFTRTFITENRWKLVLDGLWITVLLSVLSGLLGSVMGFGICMLRRSSKRAASVPAAVFIRLIQGTPIVVLLMILYYIIFGSVDISAILVAVIGFSVNFGVYVSEMMRTGIDTVDKGQIEAAQAIGFTRAKTFWKITFPQAARHFLPILKGEFISMVKMTSVVGYIAIQDLTKVSDIIRSRTLEAFFPLIATAMIYFLVANVLTLLLSRIEMRLDPKRRKRTVKGVVMR